MDILNADPDVLVEELKEHLCWVKQQYAEEFQTRTRNIGDHKRVARIYHETQSRYEAAVKPMIDAIVKYESLRIRPQIITTRHAA